MNQPRIPQYDLVSSISHWVTAVAVTIGFVLSPGDFGRLMRQGVDPSTRTDIVWHESLGMLVFALTAMRLVWASVRPAPPQVPMAAWMHSGARVVHVMLWGLLLALPATAFLALGSESHPMTLLWGVRIDRMPLIADSAIALARFADWGDVHKYLGDSIMWLGGLHAAAALFHHMILKDRTLSAMLPWGRSR